MTLRPDPFTEIREAEAWLEFFRESANPQTTEERWEYLDQAAIHVELLLAALSTLEREAAEREAALAASESLAVRKTGQLLRLTQRAVAAEARVREVEAERDRWADLAGRDIETALRRADEAEATVARQAGLLREAVKYGAACGLTDATYWMRDARAVLASPEAAAAEPRPGSGWFPATRCLVCGHRRIAAVWKDDGSLKPAFVCVICRDAAVDAGVRGPCDDRCVCEEKEAAALPAVDAAPPKEDTPGTTVPPLPGAIIGLAPPDETGWWYHLRDGFYFKGIGDAVTIAVRREDDPHAFRVVTVPPNEWASVVASVSKRGDVQSAWSEALKLHESPVDAPPEPTT